MHGRTKRKGPDLKFKFSDNQPAQPVGPPRDLDSRTTITMNGQDVEVSADDLELLTELGRGAYGVVEKMRHRPSDTIMAVKRITSTVDSREQQYLLMDLDVSMRSGACPYTVHFYGALFRDGDVWICMEVMETSLDKFYPRVFTQGLTIPEEFLGKIAYSPERIDPQGVPSGYDIRSDVWSLGISMVEIATGKFPYKSWGTPFDQLKQVVMDDPPRLPAGTFSADFDNFIEQVLVKEYKLRPNYMRLLEHPFIVAHANSPNDAFADFINSNLPPLPQ